MSSFFGGVCFGFELIGLLVLVLILFLLGCDPACRLCVLQVLNLKIGGLLVVALCCNSFTAVFIGYILLSCFPAN